MGRANQGAASPQEWIDKWEVKTTCLSYASGELDLNTGDVNRDLVLERYQSQISQLFNNRDNESDGATSSSQPNSLFYAAFPGHCQLSDVTKVVAKAFLELGLPKQHSVAIIGNSSCYEALICHLATVTAGGVSACISPRLGLEDTARVCIESKADAAEEHDKDEEEWAAEDDEVKDQAADSNHSHTDTDHKTASTTQDTVANKRKISRT